MNVSKISEKQILTFLEFRRERLIEEVEKIDLTINTLKSSANILTDNGPLVERKERTIFSKKPISSAKKLVPQEVFNPFSKLDQKIAYALTTIERGNKEDILKVLSDKQPELDSNKIEKALAVRLSYLLKNNLIDAEKVSRNYQYSLKS